LNKDIVILTRKRSQGIIAIANYLTEQNIPLLSSRDVDDQNATEVRLIIHLLGCLLE
jgi:ATP-dependent exoDNAse (exonuclease V) beta subunit